MKLPRWLWSCSLGCALSVGCASEAPPPAPDASPPTPGAAWTVFVYGHADNDLSEAFERDLTEMNAASLGQLQVVVMADHDSHRSPDHPGTEWLHIAGDSAPPGLLRRDPEQDLDDPRTLEDAVAEAFQRFPAEHRAVVLWGHGVGWRGFGGDSRDGTLPHGARRRLRVDALVDALQRGLSRAGVDGPRPLDLLGFDACLMGGVETAFEARELAQVIVGSAELDYGDGWDYQGFLSYLGAHPGEPAAALAAEEVRLWSLHHSKGADDQQLRAQVAVDTRGMGEVAASVRRLGELLTPELEQLRLPLARIAFYSSPAYGADLGDRERSEYIDLRQFAEGLAHQAPDTALQAAGAALATQLDLAVIARDRGALRGAQGALHIGISGGDPTWLGSYQAQARAWDEASGWSQLVAAVGTAADDTPPDLSVTLDAPPRPTAELPMRIQLRSDAPDVVGVVATLLRREPDGSMVSLGTIAGGPMMPQQPLTLNWNGDVSELGSLAGAQAISPVPWLTGAGTPSDNAPSIIGLMAVPGQLLTSDAAPYEARLLFTLGVPQSTSMIVDVEGQPRAQDALRVGCERPGASFLPLLTVRLPDGTFSTLAGQAIALECQQSLVRVAAQPPPGEYALLVTALDAWRNVARRVEPFEIQ
jgi:hypothetical protein